MPDTDFWVFGYGSLMWRPGFAHAEVHRARIHGYRRALCVYCCEHRGTRERPGLVFGLDKGGSVVGRAFRVAAEARAPTIAQLRARELAGGAYRERILQARLGCGTEIPVLCYTADRGHERYAGGLSPSAAARIVAEATGRSGANTDYMLNTVRLLNRLGITDPWLSDVARRLAGQREAGTT
jgi:cation transport protein ChaC